MDAASFWRWRDPTSFFIVYAAATVVAFALAALLPRPTPGALVEAVGALALGIEALLPVPQALENERRRSTRGLSPLLIAAWCVGDIFKSGYAIVRREPTAFVACGLFQLAVDAVIVLQLRGVFGIVEPLRIMLDDGKRVGGAKAAAQEGAAAGPALAAGATAGLRAR
jgi:hypothetical protein